MRSDYALYLVAVIFFIITAMSFALALAEMERNLWVVTTAILGLLFIGLGYSQRPRPRPIVIKTAPSAPPSAPLSAAPPAPATAPAPTPALEVAKEEKTEAVVEAVAAPAPAQPSMIELTEVKGIGEKRKEQLKALNVISIEDLAKASAEDLASKLNISPKITGKWIENAKQLLQKS
jgi:predicted flap endonuclease-1-like 5' DNA nuclease